MADLAEPLLARVLRDLLARSRKLSDRVRREISRALGDPVLSRRLARCMQVLALYRPQIAEAVTEGRLSSIIAGMAAVADRMPRGKVSESPPEGVPDWRLGQLVAGALSVPVQMREAYLSALPPDQREFVRGRAQSAPVSAAPADRLPDTTVHLPIVDAAVDDLRSRGLLTRADYDQASEEARRQAFTVAGVLETETLDRVRNVLAENVEEGASLREFRKQALEELEEGTFLSPAHLEVVYRNAVQTGFSRGMDKVLSHPLVSDLFVYEETIPVTDTRLSPLCETVSRSGIQGTGIFRRDDPVWMKFKPPRHHNCRCGRNALTVEQAAERGVREAQTYLETGLWPARPAWVPHPPVDLPPGWVAGR